MRCCSVASSAPRVVALLAIVAATSYNLCRPCHSSELQHSTALAIAASCNVLPALPQRCVARSCSAAPPPATAVVAVEFCSFDVRRFFVQFSSDVHRTFIRFSSDVHRTCIRFLSDVHPTFVRFASDFCPTSVRHSSDFHPIAVLCPAPLRHAPSHPVSCALSSCVLCHVVLCPTLYGLAPCCPAS
ncbi:unnamed protein product [Sphagnum tenellum]